MAPSCGLVEGREGGKGRFRAKKTCAPPKSPETGPNRQGTWLFRERQRAWCRVPIFRARADGLVCPPRCCSSACAWPQDGFTALIWAAYDTDFIEDRTAIVEALIKAGANLDLQDKVSDSRTSPPPFCLNFKDFFMIPWTLARAVGGYLVARNLGPKWPKKCPKIKPRRLFGSAVPLLLS